MFRLAATQQSKDVIVKNHAYLVASSVIFHNTLKE